MAGVASDAGGDSQSGGEGTCVAARAKRRAKDKKEGNKEEEAWRVRALRRGTDVSSRRQRRRRHVVRDAPIPRTRCSPLQHDHQSSAWLCSTHDSVATILLPFRFAEGN